MKNVLEVTNSYTLAKFVRDSYLGEAKIDYFISSHRADGYGDTCTEITYIVYTFVKEEEK